MKKIEIEEGDNKFIHYRSVDEEGVVSKNLPWHKQIYHSLKDEIEESDIVGGGRINLDKENKIISVYSHSGSYGSTSHNHIIKLLMAKYGSEYTFKDEIDLRKEQEKAKIKKKNKVLESICQNEGLLNTISSMPVKEKIRLKKELGVNRLTPEEVKDYILDISSECFPELNDLIELTKDFSLEKEPEIKSLFLDKRARRHVRGRLKYRGGYDYYTKFESYASTLESLYEYVKKLESMFPLNKEDVKPLAEEIINSNMNSTLKSHEEYRVPLLDECYIIAKEFDIDKETLEDILDNKITKRLYHRYLWRDSEEERKQIIKDIDELPVEKQELGKKAIDYLRNALSEGEYTDSHEVFGFAYDFIRYFEDSLDDSQKKELKESMNKGAIDYIEDKNTSYSDKFGKEVMQILKGIMGYDSKNAIKDAMIDFFSKKLLDSYKKSKLVYPIEQIIESGIFSKGEVSNICKSIFSDYENKSYLNPNNVFEVFKKIGLDDKKKQEIFDAELEEIIGSEDISEEQARSYAKIVKTLDSNKLKKPEYDIKGICNVLTDGEQSKTAYMLTDLVEGFDKLKAEIVDSIISENGKYGVHSFIKNNTKFFKEYNEDPSGYKESLKNGIEKTCEKYEDEDPKDYLTNMINLKLGLLEEGDTETIQAIIDYRFDNIDKFEISSWSTNELIKEFDIPKTMYMDNVDVLIESLLSEGDIKEAARVAELFDHPQKEEYALIRQSLGYNRF